ncbi:uncharacterized protein si:dkey-261j15.2 [Hypomesus transpacificus]|uniref:uncharacterized protein si:dkey-261j15.2 n=1 Tax=Hypomesus transpacificus TaxID=137520 RepID=UPI001F0876D4|nr:uncharacterized protein si:dkey-261j15.2 [Hypomesus transpacificus]
MDAKLKQQWSEEETKCLLALWSTTEVQNKLDGAVRRKPIFENIKLEMAAAGYDRSIEQLINKIKKLKKEYRDQNKDLGRSGSGRPKKSPYYDILESVLGDRPACQVRGVLNSAGQSFAASGKRKRANEDLIVYMEKADTRFLDFSREMMQKMEADTGALLGLMGRMVTAMESQANK